MISAPYWKQTPGGVLAGFGSLCRSPGGILAEFGSLCTSPGGILAGFGSLCRAPALGRAELFLEQQLPVCLPLSRSAGRLSSACTQSGS